MDIESLEKRLDRSILKKKCERITNENIELLEKIANLEEAVQFYHKQQGTL